MVERASMELAPLDRFAARREKSRACCRAYYVANRERLAEKRRLRHAANPEKLAERNRAYRAANRDKCIEYSRDYYAANHDKFIQHTRAWRRANPEALAEQRRLYRAKNSEKRTADGHLRRARKRSADGSHTAADIKRIRAAQSDKCACCRVRLKGRGHLDHIVALAAGGSNWPSNLQYLCRSCNLAKGARDPIEFMQARGMLL